MNISHLRYALEVEKTGSITQAADNLFMGQPNLSKAIKELEAAVGIPIFKRTYRGVVPTVQGKQFLMKAKEIMMQVEDLERMYIGEKRASRFSVGVPRAGYISYAFTKFASEMAKEDRCMLDFIETDSEGVIDHVADGLCNMGIIRYVDASETHYKKLIAEKNLKTQVLCSISLAVLLSERDPLAQKEVLNEEDLTSMTQVVHGDWEGEGKIRHAPGIHVGTNSKKIQIYERGSQFEVLGLVKNTYMWASPVPPELLKRYGLVQRRCEGGKKRITDVLIQSEIYSLTEQDRKFLSCVKETIAEFDEWMACQKDQEV